MSPWILPLSLLITFEAIADILAKEWQLHRGTLLWVGAIGAYVVANSFWLFALKNGSGLARGGMIFSITSAILASAIGLLIYKESVNRMELMGMGLGLISLVLICWKE